MGRAGRAALMCAAGLALAGCDTGLFGGGEADEPRPTYAELTGEADALWAEADALAYTDPSTLPTEGEATYEGVMTLGSDAADRVPDMAGALEVEVDFDGSDLEGEARDFVTAAGEEMTGVLSIDGGQVFREMDPDEDYTFNAILSGRLEDEEGDNYEFGGGFDGDFRGSSHSHIAGDVEGSVVTPEGGDFFLGEFVAER